MIQSKNFRQMFSNVTEQQLFKMMTGYCSFKSGGPLGNDTIAIIDDKGERHEFAFESFCYRYKNPSNGSYGFQVLTLGIQTKKLTGLTSVGSWQPETARLHA